MTDIKTTDTLPLPEVPQGLELLGYGVSYHQQLCEMLEQMELFTQSSQEDIEVMARFVHAYHAPANTTILREGVKERMLWFLVSGEMQVEKTDDTGTTKQLATIGPGRSIGEIAFIDEQPHSARVSTSKDSTLILLTRDNFLQMAAKYPHQCMNLTWRLALQLSQRLRQTSGILIDYL